MVTRSLPRLQVNVLGEEPPTSMPWLTQPSEATPPVQGIYTIGRISQDASIVVDPVEVPDSYSVLDSSIAEGASLEAIQEAQQKNMEIRNAVAYASNFSAVDTALAQDPVVASEVFKIQTRFGRAQESLMDYAEEAMDDGTFGKIMEFADMLVYFTLDDILAAPRALSGEGGTATEISEIYLEAASTMSDVEFDDFIMDRLDRLDPDTGESGVLGPLTDNYYVIMRELEALDKAGFVLHDKTWSALASGAIVAEAGYYAVRGATALSKIGRSTVGRLRDTAGMAAATEALTDSGFFIRRAEDVTEEVVSGAPARVASQMVEDAQIIDDSVPTILRSGGDGVTPPPVGQGRIANSVEVNAVIEQFVRSERRHSFGAADYISDATSWAAIQATRLSERFGRPLIDTDLVNEGMQNYRMSAVIGRTDGKGFKSFSSAERVAKTLPAANIVDLKTGKKVAGDTGSGQFGVLFEERYNVRSGIGPEDMAEVVAASILRRNLGKSSGISPDFMNNLANQAEFGDLGFKRHFQDALRDVTNLGKRDYRALDIILEGLRDAPDMAGQRQWYSIEEVGKAYENITGKPITNKVLKAYERIVELSDFAYYIEASKRLQDLAAQNALMVRFNNGVETLVFPRTADRVDDTAWAVDVRTNTRVKASNLDEGVDVFETLEPMADGSRYVVNIANRNRLPELNDALGYNAGGHRTNPNIKYFIGTFEGGRWTTLLGARTHKESMKAVEEWNNIVAGLKSGMDRTELDDLIRSNNTFNPNIENLDDVREFAKTRGIDLDKKIVVKERGTELGDSLSFADETFVTMPIEKVVRFTRQDEVLVEFGGHRTKNPDPILSIVNRFSKAATTGAQTQYRLEHTTAWATALRKAIDDKSIARPKNMPVGPTTDEALLRNVIIDGNTELAMKFKNEQEIILRRLNLLKGSAVDTSGSRQLGKLSDAAGRVLEAVYNRPILRTIDATMLNIFKVDAKGIKEFVIDNGSAKLMSMGFLQKMTSPDQFFLQSTHALSIAYATSFAGNLNGMRGVFLGATLRMAAQRGSDSAWHVLNGRLARLLGVPEDVFNSLVTHLKDSGRGYMKGAVADDPAARTLMNRGLTRVKNALAIPFYAGENYAATVSRITAFLDVHKANPSIGTTSAVFWNKVVARDRDLSFAMSSSNKSRMQTDDVARVLGQWESFRMAAIEHVFFNKTLSKMERAGFATSLTASYGALGLGVYGIASWAIPESWGEDTKELILHGPHDYILNNTVGIRMGTRISPIAGVTPWQGTLDKLVGFYSQFNETVPSLKLGSETATRLGKVIADIFSARPSDILAYDALRLARVMKVVDGPVMAYEMRMQDTRTTSSGGRIPHEYSSIQEFMQAIGFTPTQAVDIGLAGNLVYNLKGRRDKAIKNSKRYFTRALEAMSEGDYETAEFFYLEGSAVIDAYGFSPTHRQEVLNSSFGKTGMERLEFMLNEMLKAGLTPSQALVEGATF